jgi:hypothetical protein
VDVTALTKWLAEPRPELVAAVTEGVRSHVASLRSRGIEFYGYALLPGEPYDIRSLVAVANTEADIKAPRTDSLYGYYRYSVDEWAHWERDRFMAADGLMAEANQRFRTLHTRADGDRRMDEYELAHADALLDAIVSGLRAARDGGAFCDADPFLVVWISDSGHRIMAESISRLNPTAVAREAKREFGW